MKINNHKLFIIMSLIGLGTTAQTQEQHPAQITFKVEDDSGQPVGNVEVGMSTFHHWESGEGFGRDANETFTGTTDRTGIVTISARSLRGEFSFGVQPHAGYYPGGGGRHRFREIAGGRWVPWNPVIKVVIKPILNPVAMYARRVGDGVPFKLPGLNTPFGFDLMAGDWVSPYGKGHSNDLIFALTEIIPFVESAKPFRYVLTLTFSNPGDGVREAPSENSVLRTPRHAPEDGYEPNLEKQMAVLAKGAPMRYDVREDLNYFIRVRTEKDEDGHIKSAFYGKIVGDIRFSIDGALRFSYYLNPNPLDRNMEFDPRHNLFTRLGSLESISNP